MNRWVKSLIFAFGCSLIFGMLTMVVGSSEVSQQVIPGNRPTFGFSGYTADKVITTETYRNIPDPSVVMGGTFIGAFLIGASIFKQKES